jgi:hypothetical protein
MIMISLRTLILIMCILFHNVSYHLEIDGRKKGSSINHRTPQTFGVLLLESTVLSLFSTCMTCGLIRTLNIPSGADSVSPSFSRCRRGPLVSGVNHVIA